MTKHDPHFSSPRPSQGKGRGEGQLPAPQERAKNWPHLAVSSSRDAAERIRQRYAVAITPQMADLIDRDDPADPIARQFVPDARELEAHPGEAADPIADRPHSPLPGLVHRYADRVLIKIASVCPVYCRFCFRREMIGPKLGEALSQSQFEAALDYIRARPGINEVIFTGGDPFVLSARRIHEATRAAGAIPHVEKLRWHSRVPVVDPQRVNAELIEALKASGKPVRVAIHTNHARELSENAREAIRRLAKGSITLLSQTVLLRGINDDAAVLADLMRALVSLSVTPYYLHHGDLAPGTSHFRTTIGEGRTLFAGLRYSLPARMLPSYVLDIPGGFGKVPIETHVTARGDGRYDVRDATGRIHIYEDCCAHIRNGDAA